MKRAFSLIELSIVLVILGLLVGGILAGQSLIRASELRTVAVDQARYVTALQAFRDRYFALPGDITNATVIWGKDTAVCNGSAGAAGTPGTCNGNGDNKFCTGAPEQPECLRAWQHLALAGLVEGNYTGVQSGGLVVPGTNVPTFRAAPTGGWTLIYSGNTWNYTGNMLFVSGPSISVFWGPVFTPTDAWMVDKKVDDGIPDSGKMLSGSDFADCVTPGAADYSGPPANRSYNLAITTTHCRLWFMLQ